MRDAMANAASRAGKRLLHPFLASSGQPIIGVDETEDFWALKDISFEVKLGDRIGIIGRNGAGKSTLLKLLSRITEPTSGKISIKGRVASLLEVGTGFHPELTGRENIYLNGAVLGMGKAEIKEKFDEIVDFAEVEKFLDTPVKRYSSGMYVRLAFAVAAHLEPEILIVDEVLAVGDSQFQKKCLGKMRAAGREGRTVLFVSHNMAAIEHLCSQCLLLDDGSIVDRGATSNVIASYLERFTHDMEETGRKEVGGAFIREIRLLNENREIASSFVMGRPFRVEVDTVDISPNLQVSLSLVTVFGMRVFTLNTGMVCNYGSKERLDEETFALEINELPLVPGQYYIEMSVAQKGVGRLEHLENIMTIEVVGQDIYGSGYKLNDHYGLVYVDGSWVVKNRESRG